MLGIVIGVIIHYVYPSQKQDQFYLAVGDDDIDCSGHAPVRTFEVGDRVILTSQGGDEFRCSISSKIFKTRQGDRIEEAVSNSHTHFLLIVINSPIAPV